MKYKRVRNERLRNKLQAIWTKHADYLAGRCTTAESLADARRNGRAKARLEAAFRKAGIKDY